MARWKITLGPRRNFFLDDLSSSKSLDRFAVLNLSDKKIRAIEEDLDKDIRLIGFSTSPKAEIFEKGTNIVLESSDYSLTETKITISIDRISYSFSTPLIGSYNIENILAAIACLIGFGFEPQAIISEISKIESVPGRMQRLESSQRNVVIDYAHTPDALERAIRALRELNPKKIITVFGCGGDRDRGKRPLMARVVESGSDEFIITNDNPRHEDENQIIADILEGMSENARLSVELDRRKAIELAVSQSTSEDFVLIAGKGHEDYQDIKGEKSFFSDEFVANEVLSELSA